MRPNDCKFLKSHEWCKVVDGIATIGITDYAVSHLSDLVFLDLPAKGSSVTIGESFGEIESVKAVSDLYSPVDGRVVEVNAELAHNLEHLADDPYGNGWFVKIAVSDAAGLTKLMDETAYRKQCEEEMNEH